MPFFESKGGALPSLLNIMSAEFNTWLLGLGGYAGLFGALAVFYLYPTFPRNYLPALFVVPILSAAALYTFFQGLYLVLWFTVQVLEAMLNEHLTIVLLSTTFIGGQAVLIGYVVYKNAFVNNIVLNNAAYEEEEEGEQEGGDEEGEEGGDLQPEEYEDAAAADEDSGADADNEEGAPNLSSAPITHDTPATATPVVSKCVDCDADCTKCMPGLMPLDTATGVSHIDSDATAAINALIEEMVEDVKID